MGAVAPGGGGSASSADHIEVDPELLIRAGQEMGALGTQLGMLSDALGSVVSTGIASGLDPAGLNFGLTYGDKAQQFADGLANGANAYKAVGYKLEATGYNYKNADAASTIGGAGPTGGVGAVPSTTEAADAATGPTATIVPPPPKWALITGFLTMNPIGAMSGTAPTWPSGVPGLMRLTATQWSNLASGFAVFEEGLAAVKTAVGVQDIPEGRQIDTALTDLGTGMTSLSSLATEIAKLITQFADDVQQAQDAIRRLLDRLSIGGLLDAMSDIFTGDGLELVKEVARDIGEVLESLQHQVKGVVGLLGQLTDAISDATDKFQRWMRTTLVSAFGEEVGGRLADIATFYNDIQVGVLNGVINTVAGTVSMADLDTWKGMYETAKMVAEDPTKLDDVLTTTFKEFVAWDQWTGDHPGRGLGEAGFNIATLFTPGGPFSKGGTLAKGATAAHDALKGGKLPGLEKLSGLGSGKNSLEGLDDLSALGSKAPEMPEFKPAPAIPESVISPNIPTGSDAPGTTRGLEGPVGPPDPPGPTGTPPGGRDHGGGDGPGRVDGPAPQQPSSSGTAQPNYSPPSPEPSTPSHAPSTGGQTSSGGHTSPGGGYHAPESSSPTGQYDSGSSTDHGQTPTSHEQTAPESQANGQATERSGGSSGGGDSEHRGAESYTPSDNHRSDSGEYSGPPDERAHTPTEHQPAQASEPPSNGGHERTTPDGGTGREPSQTPSDGNGTRQDSGGVAPGMMPVGGPMAAHAPGPVHTPGDSPASPSKPHTPETAARNADSKAPQHISPDTARAQTPTATGPAAGHTPTAPIKPTPTQPGASPTGHPTPPGSEPRRTPPPVSEASEARHSGSSGSGSDASGPPTDLPSDKNSNGVTAADDRTDGGTESRIDDESSHSGVPGLSDEKRQEIITTEKGDRPDPSTYLPAEYIEQHLAKFADGATRFMPESNLEKYGIAQRDGTSFVMPKHEADALIESTQGDPRALERALGLPEGFLDSNTLKRIDIATPADHNLRIPSGNEAGANDQWIPGGQLPDGASEAVINGGDVPPNGYTVRDATDIPGRSSDGQTPDGDGRAGGEPAAERTQTPADQRPAHVSEAPPHGVSESAARPDGSNPRGSSPESARPAQQPPPDGAALGHAPSEPLKPAAAHTPSDVADGPARPAPESHTPPRPDGGPHEAPTADTSESPGNQPDAGTALQSESPDRSGPVGNPADERVYGPHELAPVEYPAYQTAVEDALRDSKGQYLVHADPRTNDYGHLINDGGPEVMGRSNNCLDCSLAALSSFRGDPTVSVPRHPDELPNGMIDMETGERSGLRRAADWLGGMLLEFNLPGQPLARHFDALHQYMDNLGPGSAALVVNGWHARDLNTGEFLKNPDGSPISRGSHATVVVYPEGADGPVWWDPQQGLASDRPPSWMVDQSSYLHFTPIEPSQGAAHDAGTGDQGTSAGVSGSDVTDRDVSRATVQGRMGGDESPDPRTDEFGSGGGLGTTGDRFGDGNRVSVPELVGDDGGGGTHGVQTDGREEGRSPDLPVSVVDHDSAGPGGRPDDRVSDDSGVSDRSTGADPAASTDHRKAHAHLGSEGFAVDGGSGPRAVGESAAPGSVAGDGHHAGIDDAHSGREAQEGAGPGPGHGSFVDHDGVGRGDAGGDHTGRAHDGHPSAEHLDGSTSDVSNHRYVELEDGTRHQVWASSEQLRAPESRFAAAERARSDGFVLDPGDGVRGMAEPSEPAGITRDGYDPDLSTHQFDRSGGDSGSVNSATPGDEQAVETRPDLPGDGRTREGSSRVVHYTSTTTAHTEATDSDGTTRDGSSRDHHSVDAASDDQHAAGPWEGPAGQRAASLLPADDSGYRIQPRDCEFLGISPEQVEAWANRDAPLGMTPTEFRDFNRGLYDALAREGFTPGDIDVRLQGSSARFFSGEHKVLPLESDIHDNIAAQARMNAWLGDDTDRPLRRPFDSMHRLGLDDEPSDYDVQISSDSMVAVCRQRWEADGSHGGLVHRKYGFVVKEIFEDMFPSLWEWADEWTERTGRPVVPALFSNLGPPDTSSSGVSSHFRESDWRMHPEGTEPPEPPVPTRTRGGHDSDSGGGVSAVDGDRSHVPQADAIGPDGRYKLSGHGNYYAINGTMRVPEGTTFTVYAEHGSPITGALGNLVETGGDTSRVYSRTYYPGEEVPNYTLEPPDGLNIMGTTNTVDRPTQISDLLRPNMGNVDFAACLGYTSNKVFDVEVIYDRDTFEVIHKYKIPAMHKDEYDDW